MIDSLTSCHIPLCFAVVFAVPCFADVFALFCFLRLVFACFDDALLCRRRSHPAMPPMLSTYALLFSLYIAVVVPRCTVQTVSLAIDTAYALVDLRTLLLLCCRCPFRALDAAPYAVFLIMNITLLWPVFLSARTLCIHSAVLLSDLRWDAHAGSRLSVPSDLQLPWRSPGSLL